METGSLLKIIDLKRLLLYILLLALIVGGVVWVLLQFERQAPIVNIMLHSDYISTKPFMVEINDKGKGLKMASISLLKAGRYFPKCLNLRSGRKTSP
jgi:hypothetical protein